MILLTNDTLNDTFIKNFYDEINKYSAILTQKWMFYILNPPLFLCNYIIFKFIGPE